MLSTTTRFDDQFMISPTREADPQEQEGEVIQEHHHVDQEAQRLRELHGQELRMLREARARHWLPEDMAERDMLRFFYDPENVPCSRQIVRTLIGMLAGRPEPDDRPLSKDLSTMGRFFSSLAESVEESVITQDEAEALIGIVLEGFVSRRFYKSLRGLAHPGKWFLTAMHHRHGE